MDEGMKKLFKEERDKLGNFPSADADFIAFERACKRLEEKEEEKNCTQCDHTTEFHIN